MERLFLNLELPLIKMIKQNIHWCKVRFWFQRFTIELADITGSIHVTFWDILTPIYYKNLNLDVSYYKILGRDKNKELPIDSISRQSWNKIESLQSLSNRNN